MKHRIKEWIEALQEAGFMAFVVVPVLGLIALIAYHFAV